MLHDLFTNAAILLSFLLLLGQFFKRNDFGTRQIMKNQVVAGAVFGALGIALMLFTIKVTNIVIIDLRNIPIICSAIIAGPFASILSATFIATFRIIFYGTNTASISAFIVILMMGIGAAYINNMKLKRWFKFACMFLLTMLLSSAVLTYLLWGSDRYLETIIYYWLIDIVGTIIAYFTCLFIISDNSNFKMLTYYKMTADNLSDMISTHKQGGEIIFVSAPLTRLFGYTLEEFTGTLIYNYIHPEDINRVRETFSNPGNEQDTATLTFRMKKKDGQYVWVEISVKTIKNADGSIKERICVTRDISIRKKMEHELQVSNERFKAIFDYAGTGIVLREHNGNLIDANPAYLSMMGYSKEEVYHLDTIVHPESYEKVRQLADNLRTGKSTLERSEIHYLDKNKKLIIADVISTIIHGTEHTPGSIIRIVNNITERKHIEQKLRESEERFRTAFNNAVIGMYLSSFDGIYFKVNYALCDLLGYSEQEMLGMNYKQVTHTDYLEKESELRKQLLEGEIPNFLYEKCYLHKNGKVIWALLGLSVVYDAEGNPLHFIGHVQDITYRKYAEEELRNAKQEAEKLASIDYLTGIMNRRAFEERFSWELKRSEREKTPISLVLADIDYFKKVNDTYGHMVGDYTLQEFAKCLAGSCRPYDFLGRHGGEEFLICLPNTDCEQAANIAERMRRSIEELVIDLESTGKSIRITASFGVASTMQGRENSINSLTLQADKAMYKAKSSGRNRVCMSVDEC